MKQIHKTYKFRIEPTDEQKVLLAKHFGCMRFVYNHFLAERSRYYLENKKGLNYYDNANALTLLKKEKVWLKEVNSQAMQAALKHLEGAYNTFFRKQSAFPRFKSRNDKQSFKVPQFTRVENGRIYIPKFSEGIEINLHRKMEGKILFATISKTPTHKYFASITCEVEYTPHIGVQAMVGVDLGIKSLLVDSTGKPYPNIKTTAKYASKLRIAQKHLARKVKGSSSRNRQKLKVARIHEKITSVRLDNLHKITSTIIKENQLIAVEDLAVKNLMQNRKLSKHIADVSWGKFLTLLQYKAEWNDRQVVKIDRFFPSSKTCTHCGWINQNLTLADRTWTCGNGHTLDRDVNAAQNILKQALNSLSVGTVEYTDGEPKSRKRKVSSVKSEAPISLE